MLAAGNTRIVRGGSWNSRRAVLGPFPGNFQRKGVGKICAQNQPSKCSKNLSVEKLLHSCSRHGGTLCSLPSCIPKGMELFFLPQAPLPPQQLHPLEFLCPSCPGSGAASSLLIYGWPNDGKHFLNGHSGKWFYGFENAISLCSPCPLKRHGNFSNTRCILTNPLPYPIGVRKFIFLPVWNSTFYLEFHFLISIWNSIFYFLLEFHFFFLFGIPFLVSVWNSRVCFYWEFHFFCFFVLLLSAPCL